jgi:hypothetical protein
VSRATVEAYFASVNADSFADLTKEFTPDVETHNVRTRPVVGREGSSRISRGSSPGSPSTTTR